MTAAVTVRHNFETAHRLPHLPGKCTSLHGHSWWASVTVAAEIDAVRLPRQMVVEFGPLKRVLRGWIDTYLDHGTMLGFDDPLRPALLENGCKVFTFDPAADGTLGMAWPTVENVAWMLAGVAERVVREVDGTGSVFVSRVRVQETHVNSASWSLSRAGRR